MTLISFTFYKEYFYFLCYWVIDLIDDVERYIFEYKNNIPSEEKYPKEESLINLIISITANLLAGFLVLYTNIRMNAFKKNKNLKKKNDKYQLIYNDLSIKENKYYFILLISILDFITLFIVFLYNLFLSDQLQPNRHDLDWLIAIDIFMRIIFSKLILKKEFYKHHIFGLLLNGISFIFLIFLNIYRINFQNKKPKQIWIYFLFFFPRFILVPLGDTINKILLTDKFLLPHNLMFYRGIIETIIIIILVPILFLCTNIKFEYVAYLLNDSHKSLICFMNIIFQFFRAFITMKIIYIFTPQHVCFLPLADMIADMIYNLFIVKKDN